MACCNGAYTDDKYLARKRAHVRQVSHRERICRTNIHKGTQMTVMATLTDAPLTSAAYWTCIQWDIVTAHVRRLQMRIAKATREQKLRKVQSLQWLLTHSHYAKLLAIKRVTENKGAKTPGVDKKIVSTPGGKAKLAGALSRKDYKALPLRRIYIPKNNGKKRPLGIPTMKCRAMQALHLLALEPIAETRADWNSYGFRPHRSCADAIQQCALLFSKKASSQWVLEGDIKGCFDNISQDWMLKNVLTDTLILRKWLNAGFIEKSKFSPTTKGTPQGGIISPLLANIVLDGMEAVVKTLAKRGDKIHMVRYADDFVISGRSKEILEQKVKPAIEAFLMDRGLELSMEKTKITHINDGFDFLGFTIRKYRKKFLTKPSKNSVKQFLCKVREIIKSNPTQKTESLIRKLNPVIRGWCNYFRISSASRTFSYIDNAIFKAIWTWVKRRHPQKNCQFMRRKYFCQQELRNWVFFTNVISSKGEVKRLTLQRAGDVKIKRHIKIIGEATPYDPNYLEYFESRTQKKRSMH